MLARAHNLAIVPIQVTGTSAAMPPGRLWPRRLQGNVLSHRHRIEVSFGEPIGPEDEPRVLTERVQRFFEDGDGEGASPSPYRRLAAAGSAIRCTAGRSVRSTEGRLTARNCGH